MHWWLVATLVSVATAVPFELSDAKRAFFNSGAVKLSARDHSECFESQGEECSRHPELFIEYYNGSDPEYFVQNTIPFGQFAKDMLKNSDVVVTFFDCAESPEACARVGIKKLPSRRLNFLKQTINYNGALDRQAVTQRLRSSIAPVPRLETHESFDRFWNDKSKPKVLSTNRGKASLVERGRFLNFARSFSDQFTCAKIVSRSIHKVLRDKVPQVSIRDDEAVWLYISANGKEVRVYPFGELRLNDFLDFVGVGNHPVAIFYPDDWYNPLAVGRDPSIPAAVMVIDRTSDAEVWGPELAELAREYTGQLQFATWQTKSFNSSLPTIFPNTTLFAIYDYQSGQVHTIDSKDYPDGIQFETIEAMVEDFLAGNMKYRSEPVPVANGPVTTLVGENVLEAIGNVSQTVFVNYCEDGQCRANQTIWQSLAAHYADNDTVLVAQYDFIKNERVPGKRVYAPTLAMYPANGAIDETTGFRNPVYYNAGVNSSWLIDFVEHGDPYGDIVELSIDTIEGFVADHGKVVVWYYAPSRIDMDEDSHMTAKLKFDLMRTFEPTGTFARVNCDQERYLCRRHTKKITTVKAIGSNFFGVPTITDIEELEKLFDETPRWVVLHLNPTKYSSKSFTDFARRQRPGLYSMAQVADAITESVEERFPDTELGDGPTWLVIFRSKHVGVLTGNRFVVKEFQNLIDQLVDYEIQDILEERFQNLMRSKNTLSENDSSSSEPTAVIDTPNDNLRESSYFEKLLKELQQEKMDEVFNLYVKARLENPEIAENIDLFFSSMDAYNTDLTGQETTSSSST
ncbi:hypothetical protein DICA3_F37984 [Diutina catenulata]